MRDSKKELLEAKATFYMILIIVAYLFYDLYRHLKS